MKLCYNRNNSLDLMFCRFEFKICRKDFTDGQRVASSIEVPEDS